MPANRHRRRATAAYARRQPAVPTGGRSPLGRAALAVGGLLLMALALFLLLAPTRTRGARGAMFALVFGIALVASAFLPGRR
jgi:hypothetical protein